MAAELAGGDGMCMCTGWMAPCMASLISPSASPSRRWLGRRRVRPSECVGAEQLPEGDL